MNSITRGLLICIFVSAAIAVTAIIIISRLPDKTFAEKKIQEQQEIIKTLMIRLDSIDRLYDKLLIDYSQLQRKMIIQADIYNQKLEQYKKMQHNTVLKTNTYYPDEHLDSLINVLYPR